MYSLDINFLNDRPEYRSEAKKGAVGPRPQVQSGSQTPLLIGAAVGLILPAAVLGYWFILNGQNEQLQTDINTLDGQIKDLQGRLQQAQALNEQIKQVTDETNALATVFNQVKPWSAMLQAVREGVPPNVQLQAVRETDPPAPTEKEPNPTSTVEIGGIATSFDDVNDFLLMLQKSPFFNPEKTRITAANLIDNPVQIEMRQTGNQLSTAQYKLPQVVDFRIQTQLSAVPASELLRELSTRGAVGLVTRIKTLQEKGVIQQ